MEGGSSSNDTGDGGRGGQTSSVRDGVGVGIVVVIIVVR